MYNNDWTLKLELPSCVGKKQEHIGNGKITKDTYKTYLYSSFGHHFGKIQLNYLIKIVQFIIKKILNRFSIIFINN